MCREYNTFLIAFNGARLEEIAFMAFALFCEFHLINLAFYNNDCLNRKAIYLGVKI